MDERVGLVRESGYGIVTLVYGIEVLEGTEDRESLKEGV